jgi:hypothetical protein
MSLIQSRPLLASAALFFSAGVLTAQSGATSPYASSESTVGRLAAIVAGGGSASSNDFGAEAALAGPPAAARAVSESFVATGGAVTVPASLGAGAPVVLATEPDAGEPAAGAPVRVRGAHLAEAAGGAPTVLFGAQPAGVLTAQSTAVDLLAPAGLGPAGNPLGATTVEVQTAAGAGALEGGYVYTPALVWSAPPMVGATAEVLFRGEPGAYLFLAYGVSSPGFALPLPPFDGALELALAFPLVGGVPTGADGTLVHAIPIPDSPGLEGVLLELQALAMNTIEPLAGGFTNRLAAAVGG